MPDNALVAGYRVKAANTNAPINVATPTVITARKNLAIPAPTSAPKNQGDRMKDRRKRLVIA